MTQLPVVIDEMTKLTDEELCLMLEEEAAWVFHLTPHEEPHSAPYIGNELFTLYSEIVRRLRKYSKENCALILIAKEFLSLTKRADEITI